GGPLGDAPVQMVDRTTRDRQLREVRVAGQAGDTGTPRLCLFNVLVALAWVPDLPRCASSNGPSGARRTFSTTLPTAAWPLARWSSAAPS
ncbi:MAG: hypothetical protein ACJ8CR_06875, partial [Roseiflexaceae bacterium]